LNSQIVYDKDTDLANRISYAIELSESEYQKYRESLRQVFSDHWNRNKENFRKILKPEIQTKIPSKSVKTSTKIVKIPVKTSTKIVKIPVKTSTKIVKIPVKSKSTSVPTGIPKRDEPGSRPMVVAEVTAAAAAKKDRQLAFRKDWDAKKEFLEKRRQKYQKK
jgi:hypothetical protein